MSRRFDSCLSRRDGVWSNGRTPAFGAVRYGFDSRHPSTTEGGVRRKTTGREKGKGRTKVRVSEEREAREGEVGEE